MNISLDATLKGLENKINAGDFLKAYQQALRLRNQLLGVLHDQEEFGVSDGLKLADMLSDGNTESATVTLTIYEPLPSMKELTSALSLHWTDLIHAAIRQAANKGKLPRFVKALVWIEVTTPKGTNNRQLWDTSNRAINLIINNLKGIFFADDNLEHMAFGVAGRWGEEGKTVIQIRSFDAFPMRI